MIFTLFGYLLLVGAVRRDVRSSIVSIAVLVMVRAHRGERMKGMLLRKHKSLTVGSILLLSSLQYGGLLWALLPLRDRTVSLSAADSCVHSCPLNADLTTPCSSSPQLLACASLQCFRCRGRAT